MALKNNCQLPAYGKTVVIADAYCRVDTINGSKNTMAIQLGIYSDQGQTLVAKKTYQFLPDLNGENFIRQAYLHLKKLPEFDQAQDC